MENKNKTVYLKPKRNAEVTQEAVFLKDVASLTCGDEHLLAKAKALKVHQFREGAERRVVISNLRFIQMIQELDAGVIVENVGEMDTLVRLVKTDRTKGFLVFFKVVFVSLISFFGTAFTIMAFHNDIGIHDVFGRLYELIMGQTSNGFTTLEVTYSLGLAVGITLFFNHIGGRRIATDPTPIEVEMRVYEKDVDDTLIETADREGKTIDAS